MIPPKLFIEINGPWSCNFRCPTCCIESRKKINPIKLQQEKNISYHTLEPVIKDYLSVYPEGSIIIQGGEPMLYFDKFISIVTQIRKNYPDILIGTVSNCSQLQNKRNFEIFAKSGISYLACSLNSHIPKVHNLSRGLKEKDNNCEFILSLPEKLKNTNISAAISAIPDSFNIGHLKEFVEETKKRNFANITFCFTKEMINKEDTTKLIRFYIWIMSQTGDMRKYILNPDSSIKNTIKWYLEKGIPSSLKCNASKKAIVFTYDSRIYPCLSCNDPLYVTGDTSRFIYLPNDISDPKSRFNTLIKTIPDICRADCMLASCYF